METQEQIKLHNKIAVRLDKVERLRSKVAIGFVVFWILLAIAFGITFHHYVPIWLDQFKGFIS